MKRTFTLLSLLLAAIVLITACTAKPSAEQAVKGVSYEDTVGFAQFQEWKAQHERLNPVNAYQPATPAPKVVYVTAPQKAVTRTSTTTATAPDPVASAPAKKGWSKAAKGTAIGAGSGAVLGAVINKKNRVLGGVIGGVVGGGIGYGIGRSMDKKDGRY
ncbi:MAG TPA: glycine zipper 2TM domain-containing protein [Chitinophagaceae bacterium]|nr:glycine zipper 2TM domain-containing protein [Chitinophagaceae bacterium]